MNEYINEILSVIITAFVIPLLTYLSSEAIKLLKEKVAELKIKKAEKVVQDAVAEVAQTYVDPLKKAGTFAEDTALVAFNKAFELATKLINEDTQNLIAEVHNNFDSWLQAKVEAAVKNK
jgi:hypothetical protein